MALAVGIASGALGGHVAYNRQGVVGTEELVRSATPSRKSARCLRMLGKGAVAGSIPHENKQGGHERHSPCWGPRCSRGYAANSVIPALGTPIWQCFKATKVW